MNVVDNQVTGDALPQARTWPGPCSMERAACRHFVDLQSRTLRCR